MLSWIQHHHRCSTDTAPGALHNVGEKLLGDPSLPFSAHMLSAPTMVSGGQGKGRAGGEWGEEVCAIHLWGTV